MLRTITTSAILCLAVVANAQEISHRTGYEFGLATSFMHADDVWDYGSERGWYRERPVVGPVLGLQSMQDIGDRFGALLGLQYQMTGRKLNYGRESVSTPPLGKTPQVLSSQSSKHVLRLHKFALPVGIGYHWIDRGSIRLSTWIGWRVNYFFAGSEREEHQWTNDQWRGTTSSSEHIDPFVHARERWERSGSMNRWQGQFFIQQTAVIDDTWILAAKLNAGGMMAWEYGIGCFGPAWSPFGTFKHSDFTLSLTYLFFNR